MDATTTQTVRTAVTPQDAQRYGSPVRTELRPGDLSRRGAPANTQVRPEEMARYPAAKPAIDPDQARHDRLTHETQRLVSQTFFGAMLRQMRNSPFKSDLFSGGRGGQAYSELYDQHLADRMARGAGRRLSATIVKHIERARLRKQNDPTAGDEASAPRIPHSTLSTQHSALR